MYMTIILERYQGIGKNYLVYYPMKEVLLSKDLIKQWVRRALVTELDGFLVGPVEVYGEYTALLYNKDGYEMEMNQEAMAVFIQSLKEQEQAESLKEIIAALEVKHADAKKEKPLEHTATVVLFDGSERARAKSGC